VLFHPMFQVSGDSGVELSLPITNVHVPHANAPTAKKAQPLWIEPFVRMAPRVGLPSFHSGQAHLGPAGLTAAQSWDTRAREE